MRVVVVEGQSYLEAWCRRAEGVRLFHLGRVQEVGVLDEQAAPPDDLPSRDLSQGLFQPAPDDTVVVLALQPEAAWVSDFYPCESVEDQGDGSQVVTLRTRGTAWVRRLALSLGSARARCSSRRRSPSRCGRTPGPRLRRTPSSHT